MADISHLIALLGNRLLQSIVRNLLRQRNDSGSGLVADLGAGYAVERLERLFDVHLAVAAHHAFDFQCLCHGFCLLLSGRFYFDFMIPFGIIHPKEIQAQGVGDDAEAG